MSQLWLAAILVALGVGPTRSWAQDSGVPATPDPLAPPRSWFQISPLPESDPHATAAEGKVVRRISIEGNNHTKRYIITRELELAVGKPFLVETMDDDIARLENLGIFCSIKLETASVSVDSTRTLGTDSFAGHHYSQTYGSAAVGSVLAVRDHDSPAAASDDSVDVTIAVREMPWLIPYPAFKISDQTGFSVGAGVASGNLLGRDITLSSKVLFGGASQYQVKIDWPWITGDHVAFNLVANHLVRNDAVREFEERSNEITPWIGTYLGEHGRLRGGFSYFTMKSDVDGVTLSADNHDILHRAGAALGYDTRDNWVNPHRGWENEVKVVQTGGPLGGDGDFLTTDIDVTRYQPVGRHTLVLSGLSSLQTGDLGEEIPSYMDYLMGGSNTIRGYRLKELGKEVSGKNQLIGTLEYQYLLWDVREVLIYGRGVTFGLELAAFVDNGLAWNTGNQFNTERNRTGFGFGLRPLIPALDELRLDLGYSQDGFVFHIASGHKMDSQRQRLR